MRLSAIAAMCCARPACLRYAESPATRGRPCSRFRRRRGPALAFACRWRWPRGRPRKDHHSTFVFKCFLNSFHLIAHDRANRFTGSEKIISDINFTINCIVRYFSSILIGKTKSHDGMINCILFCRIGFRSVKGQNSDWLGIFLLQKKLADTWCSAFVISKQIVGDGWERQESGITQEHLNELATKTEFFGIHFALEFSKPNSVIFSLVSSM